MLNKVWPIENYKTSIKFLCPYIMVSYFCEAKHILYVHMTCLHINIPSCGVIDGT